MKRLLALLVVLAGVAFAVAPATNWVAGTPAKWSPTPAGSFTTEGGNVTEVNVTADQSTEKWAGIWGNLTGSIKLTPDGTNIFYQWAWDSSRGATLCALTAGNTYGAFDWAAVQAAAAGDIDAAWGFATTDTDSATNTFTGTGSITVAGTSVSGAAAADTGAAGGFVTVALKDAATPTKNDLAFCVAAQQGGTLFNGGTGDYELMVATDEVYGNSEAYYFWVELH